MVLIFLVTKVFLKGTMFKWVCVSLSHEILSPNGRRQGLECVQRLLAIITGLPLSGCPVNNSVFWSSVQKNGPLGREDTRVWYRETIFSCKWFHTIFPCTDPCTNTFWTSSPPPNPKKPRRCCEPEEGYLRCSKRFDHRSHSIIFLLFEFKSVRWCWRWETQRNARVAFKPTRRSR